MVKANCFMAEAKVMQQSAAKLLPLRRVLHLFLPPLDIPGRLRIIHSPYALTFNYNSGERVRQRISRRGHNSVRADARRCPNSN